MVRPFGQLGNHRKHVLDWYRYSLRNIKANIEIEHLKTQVYSTLRRTVRENKNHKSAWYVRGLLQDLNDINTYILNDDLHQLLKLRDKYSNEDVITSTTTNTPPSGNALLGEAITGIKVPTDSFVLIEREEKDERKKKKKAMTLSSSPSPSSARSDRLSRRVLYSYIRKHYRPPFSLPQEHLESLIKPLAYHEYYCKKLYLIELRLAQGPPKVSLGYTGAGRARIWFVRSPLNRKKRQSKRLTTLIRLSKLQAQKNLDGARECEKMLWHGYHEAQWEYMLEKNNQMFPKTAEEVISLVKQGGNLRRLPVNFVNWLQPIIEALQQFERLDIEVQEKFRKQRDMLVEGGQYQYYHNLNQQLYANRMARFKNLKKELPVTNPFTKENNLGALLVKWKFLSPHQLLK
ncbi:Essential for respiratory growth and required for mitochondrial protein synthesis [Kluyveromyces marxianus]|nr:Essential for respiratory growth and required for mitochondrial protein synthesis [Kluyveromyces marxianus]KAG0676704.1 Essential for respiratory growth and required for mitochondrial protein synthesis [Kluyveromyces marxianus]